MLAVVLPKGSLEKQVLELFSAADLAVIRGSDRDYHAKVDDPRIAKVRFLRDVAGVERTMAGVQLTGAGWSDTFICKGQEEEKQMIAVITSLLSGSGSPARDDD